MCCSTCVYQDRCLHWTPHRCVDFTPDQPTTSWLRHKPTPAELLVAIVQCQTPVGMQHQIVA